MSLLGSFLSFGLNSGAAKKENRLKQELLNKGADISRGEFDKRMTALGGSDARISDLLNGQHTETGQNENQNFAALLDQAQKGFNEQQQIDSSGFDARNQVQGDLMTAQRAAREANARVSAAERDRQLGFQGQADDLSRALPGQIGYDAQTAGRAHALSDRAGLIASTATKVASPVFAGADPTVSGAYAAAADRGSTAGLGDALRSANLSSYGDAFQGAQRQIGSFADGIAGLTAQAGLSRSALPAELGVGRLQASDAKDYAGERDSILRGNTDRQAATASTYRDNLKGAQSSFGDQMQQLLADFYGKKLDSEGNFISGLTDSSQNLESKLLNLNNYKLNGTSVTSPLANTIRAADKAGEQAAKAMMAGG